MTQESPRAAGDNARSAAPSAPAEPAPLSSGETVYYEGGPARGDLILSLLIFPPRILFWRLRRRMAARSVDLRSTWRRGKQRRELLIIDLEHLLRAYARKRH
jgi:hypothetical protein